MAADAHMELIQQEIYLLENLAHPRIINLHTYFYSNDGKYIHLVMEYARNGSLSKMIATQAATNKHFSEKVSDILTITIWYDGSWAGKSF